ncbi:MAG: hypothetical protein Q7R95_11435 [bacterium]|nr:hypothetical protein [bacterium]
MKYKVYPKGYCPMTASGPCGEDMKRMGITWTPTDTKRMKKLEKQAVIQDFKPTNRVFQEID